MHCSIPNSSHLPFIPKGTKKLAAKSSHSNVKNETKPKKIKIKISFTFFDPFDLYDLFEHLDDRNRLVYPEAD